MTDDLDGLFVYRMGESCSPDGCCCDMVVVSGMDDGSGVDPVRQEEWS